MFNGSRCKTWTSGGLETESGKQSKETICSLISVISWVFFSWIERFISSIVAAFAQRSLTNRPVTYYTFIYLGHLIFPEKTCPAQRYSSWWLKVMKSLLWKRNWWLDTTGWHSFMEINFSQRCAGSFGSGGEEQALSRTSAARDCYYSFSSCVSLSLSLLLSHTCTRLRARWLCMYYRFS